MNRSGNAVRYWIKQRKVSFQNILVITDDVHLDLGYLRIRKQGSDGGHNGLRDIQEKLGRISIPDFALESAPTSVKDGKLIMYFLPGNLMKNICYRVLLTEQQKQ